MSETPTPNPVITLCYIGAFIDHEDGLSYEYRKVVDGKLGETMIYNRVFLGSPGTLFTIECNPAKEGSVYRNTAKFAGLWHDQDQRVKWAAQSRANENAVRESREAKKAMTENAALERLKPFKDAYRGLRPDGRRAMLAEVIRFITTP